MEKMRHKRKHYHHYYYSGCSFCLLTEPRQDQPLGDYLTTTEMKPCWMSDGEIDGQKIKTEAVEEECVSGFQLTYKT